MESGQLRETWSALEKGHTVPAYYIAGDDEYRKEVVVRRLMTSLVDPATRDFNLDVLRGGEVTAERLESLLKTPPMMSARRVIVIRDEDNLKKDARAVLVAYLKRPSADSVVVVISPAGSKSDKELASHATVLTVEPLNGGDLEDWIAEQARALGATISPAAVATLIKSVGNSAQQLAVELDKAASHADGSAIRPGDIAAVVGVELDETFGDFLNAVGERDVPRALGAIDGVLAQPKVNAVTVLMALTVQAMAIAWGVERRARSSGEFFALLKETGAFPMRPWGEAAQGWARAMSHWDRSSAQRALAALRVADQGAKDSRVASDAQLLATTVCAMCAPGVVYATR